MKTGGGVLNLKKFLFLLLSLNSFFLSPCQSALHRLKSQAHRYQSSASGLVNILKSSHHQALMRLSQMKPEVKKDLQKVSFDPLQPLDVRWRAFMALTSMEKRKESPPNLQGPTGQKLVYEKVLVCSHWNEWTSQRLKTKLLFYLKKILSLLVRLKATEILSQNQGPRTRRLFWKKLQSKDNFYKNRSLAIRSHIAYHLAQEPRSEELGRWTKMTTDPDQEVRSQALQALEQIRNQTHRKAQGN